MLPLTHVIVAVAICGAHILGRTELRTCQHVSQPSSASWLRHACVRSLISGLWTRIVSIAT